MIHHIRFRNFYSFGLDEGDLWAEIDFRIPEEAPEDRFTFRTPSGVRLNKVLAVIGPNASGKTNLIRAYSFLRFFMWDSHLRTEPEADILLASHLFEESDTVQFEMTFELQDGRQFFYCLDVTSERVVRESLTELDGKNTSTKHPIFDRAWNPEREDYDFSASEELGFMPTKTLPLRTNVSTLSTARQNASSLLQDLEKPFHLGVNNVGWDGRITMQHSRLLTKKASHIFKKNPTFLQSFNKVLGSLDLGVTRIEIVEEKGIKGKEFFPVGVHTFSGEEKLLGFENESSGIKALFVALPSILSALYHGGLSTWDEIEADLHPDMVQAIVRLFLTPETNPHNAQILFSSHNHEVLKILIPHQVILVEREAEVFSVARRLDTIEGVTEDDNIYARYLAKAYGAKPDLHLPQAVMQFLAEVDDGSAS